MNNWAIYQIVNYLINKSQVGNAFTPLEFQTILNYTSLLLYKKRLGVPEEYQLNSAFTKEGYAETSRILTDLSDFVTNDTLTYLNGITPIPSNFIYPIGMEYKVADGTCDGGYKTTLVELVDAGEAVMRRQSALKPLAKYPIYELVADNLVISPSTIRHTNFTYLSNPTEAVIVTSTDSYTGELIYDAVNSVELQWNDLAKLDIIVLVLRSAGINLRAQDITQAAEIIKQQGV